jgi:hypothetical protein
MSDMTPRMVRMMGAYWTYRHSRDFQAPIGLGFKSEHRWQRILLQGLVCSRMHFSSRRIYDWRETILTDDLTESYIAKPASSALLLNAVTYVTTTLL